MKTKEKLGVLLITAVKKAIEVNEYSDPIKAIRPPKADKSYYKVGIRPAEFKQSPQLRDFISYFLNLWYSAGADVTDKARKNWIKVGVI